MDSSTPTEELALAGEPEPAHAASAGLHPLISASVRQRCAVCGAAMAADQRYCLECGERRGAPRVSLLEGPARRSPEPTPASAPVQRRFAPVNSTLISIIGILLLAMGIGVLIGRSDNNGTVKSPPAQVVTVTGGPSTGTASSTPTTSAGGTSTSASSSTAAKTKSQAATTTTAAKSKTPLPKAVKVGTPGHGRGYKHGHFTGEFFGQ